MVLLSLVTCVMIKISLHRSQRTIPSSVAHYPPLIVEVIQPDSLTLPIALLESDIEAHSCSTLDCPLKTMRELTTYLSAIIPDSLYARHIDQTIAPDH